MLSLFTSKLPSTEPQPAKKIPNASGKTFLFFMHQNRMKTSVVKTFNELGQHSSIKFNPINEKIRFYNACIVKLTIEPTDSNGNNLLSLSLHYDGDKSAKKEDKVYWSIEGNEEPIINRIEETPIEETPIQETPTRIEENPNANRIEENPIRETPIANSIEDKQVIASRIEESHASNEQTQVESKRIEETPSKRIETKPDIKFNSRTIRIKNDILKEILHFNTNISTPIACYFVRHGVATHNIAKIKTEINTNLVRSGYDNIIEAGRKFVGIHPMNIDAIFVSDLIRTQQTAGLFLKGYYDKKQIPDTLPIYVLPCSHELNSGANDGESTVLPYFENKTNCRDNGDIDELYGPTQLCNNVVVDNKGISMEWKIYKEFYNGYRDINNKVSCAKNHFLGITFDNFLNSTKGGKPKKRSTRKVATNKKTKTSSKQPRKSRKSRL